MFVRMLLFLFALNILFISCRTKSQETKEDVSNDEVALFNGLKPISKPLITHIYTADPSVHVFENKLYIYPSHDIDSRVPETDRGDQFDMKDYHVFSMNKIDGEVEDHGVALDIKDIPWARRQLWAPDAAFKDGKYYLYFPAKDQDGIFRIGVAESKLPSGPFKAETTPIEGSYSIDPAVFRDDDGTYYMYFGGIWGGQLQNWRSSEFDANDLGPVKGEVAMGPRIVKMSDDMRKFSGEIKEIVILDEFGNPLQVEDTERRFFEGAWVHKYNGKYYLSYSTGDTHNICYATSENPSGPFTYQGILLEPVLGWTSHHSTVEFNGKWYLFYHDAALSRGKSYLRNVKVTSLLHMSDGSIKKIEPYVK